MSQSKETIIIKVIQVGSTKDDIWYSQDTISDIIQTIENNPSLQLGCFIEDVARDDPTRFNVNQVTHRIVHVYLIGDWLCATIEILDTASGRVAQSLVNNLGGTFDGVMSCRGEVSIVGEVTGVSMPRIHIRYDRFNQQQSNTLSIQLGSILG